MIGCGLRIGWSETTGEAKIESLSGPPRCVTRPPPAKRIGNRLNPDIVSIEGGNEIYGVSVSESIVRTSVSAIETLTECPLGLGQVDRCSVEGVSGDIGVFRDSVDAIHGANDNLKLEEVVGGMVGEGLEGRRVPVDEENQMESEMQSYDRGNDTGAANVSTMPIINVSKCKKVIVGGEIAKNDGLVLDLRDDGRSCDVYCGDSSCSQKNEGGSENFSTFYVDRVIKKYRETIKDEEAKVANTDDSLLERNGNMAYGSGEVTVGELADSAMEFKTWVDTDENRIMGGSDSEGGVFFYENF
ncbi:hypothetical protein F0562_018622 [Nyssa sinensis]|uniref:Uncharacterized protein n=1 Tax=Nyssa sinensis TaxID=561372 RepID=A0A5J4ZEQ2_9ASTE|nr:hypothetical protein F0562_018622 [Nyssa sinensis]